MIPLRACIYAATVVAIVGALWCFGHHQKQQGRAEIQVKFDAYVTAQKLAQAEADKLANIAAFERFKATERSKENDYKLEQTRLVSDRSARGELERLRNTIATLGGKPKQDGDASPGRRIDGSPTIAFELLGDCASKYQELAGEAGKLAGQVIGLQGFILALEEPQHLRQHQSDPLTAGDPTGQQ